MAGAGADPGAGGVHTGVAHERDNDYFGPTLNRTARLMSAAHGGQTVISAATHELITDARLLDMGEHRLKDLSRPERVWQLIIEGLTRDFPPLRTLNAVPTRPARRVRHPGPRVRPGRPLHARRRHQPWAVAIAATFRAIIETYTGHSDLARQASARAVAAAPRDLAPSFAALVGFMPRCTATLREPTSSRRWSGSWPRRAWSGPRPSRRSSANTSRRFARRSATSPGRCATPPTTCRPCAPPATSGSQAAPSDVPPSC